MARKVLIYLGALVCASAVGAVAWSSADRETAPMERGTIVAAQRGPIESTVSAFGRFEPSVEAQVSQSEIRESTRQHMRSHHGG